MIRFAAIAVMVMTLGGCLWFFALTPVFPPSHPSLHSQLPPRDFRTNRFAAPPVSALPSPPFRAINPTSGIRLSGSPTSTATGNLTPRKRTWDTNFLARLSQTSLGDLIQVELIPGEFATGKVTRLDRDGREVHLVSGEIVTPTSGRFFFEKATLPGIAGSFVGVVEFPTVGKAYRLEPSGPDRSAELVERPLSGVICVGLPHPESRMAKKIQEIPPLNPAEFPVVPTPRYQEGIDVLESLHNAKPVIYLDFRGGYTPAWGGIAYERPNLSSAEIREIWQRVAEDYMPFNINVTTDLRAYENAPKNSRQHVLITPTTTASPGAGGAAYVGSFDWTSDTPCWVFELSAPRYCAQACSHEAGHALGLIHDGQQIEGNYFEYYYGHGSGETSWAPIMGVAYYESVSQWSKGEYVNANNLEDQLVILANQNNVQFRPDDTGDTLASSRFLEVYADNTAGAQGLIERTEDIDAFQFTTAGGEISLRADPVSLGPNLAVQVSLCDASDTLLASSNPQDTLWASITTNLPPGTYTFRVAGAGRHDPLTNGFSPYASLGYYSITGSVAKARLPNRFSIPENAPVGTIVGKIPSPAPQGDLVAYSITSGNISNTFVVDSSGFLIVTNNAALDYESLVLASQLTPQFELLVEITDPSHPGLGETNQRVLVAVTNINEPPLITGFISTNNSGLFGGGFFWGPGLINWLGSTTLGGTFTFGNSSGLGESSSTFSASVLEHSSPGTVVGTVIGSDPDFYTLLSYSIAAGNSNGMFAIDAESGTITVAGDPTAAAQNLYNLTVLVSDQTPPLPLTATSTVTITVELPYTRGSASCAGYTNIPGTAVSSLALDSTFPLDPAWESGIQNLEMSTYESGDFGAVMRAYLLPPATGDYTFWVASRDNSELWLSGSTNPASMTRIAFLNSETDWAGPGEWTNFPSQQSTPVALSVGKAYYLEARLKAATSSNYLSVAWECLSNGIDRQIIPGQYLAPYRLNYVPHPIGFTANLPRNAIAGAQAGKIVISDVNGGDLETLTLLSADPPGVFSLDPKTGAVRLVDEVAFASASRTLYSLIVQATDNGQPPLSGTTTATINVVPTNAISAGSLVAEIWTNVAGVAVSNLTSQAKFPRQPDQVEILNALELTSVGLNTEGAYLNNSGSGIWSFPGLNLNSPGNHAGEPFISLSSGGTFFGSRIRGYLTPTNTGVFTFFISSADDSVFQIGFTMDPAEARPVAWVTGGATLPREWGKYSSQQSMPLWLVAGQKYYFEAMSKTGSGGLANPIGSGEGLVVLNSYGHVEVGWTGPGLPETNVIDASFVVPMDLNYAPVFPDRTVALPITTSIGAVLATLSAKDSAADTLAYKIISGNSSNTFALNPCSGELSVADSTAYQNYVLTNFTLVVEAQDSGYGGLYPLKSTLAAISITVVDNTPAFVWSGQGDDNNWSSATNWNGTAPNDRSKITFTGIRHQTNHNDYLTGAALVTLGRSGFYLDGDPLILRGGLLNRGDNTWAIPLILDGPQTLNSSSGFLKIAGSVNNAGHTLTLLVDSSLTVNGVISGSGGLTKSGSGTLILAAENAFRGPTEITAGTLTLSQTDSLATSSSISVGAGAVLKWLSLGTVPAGQTLTGNGTVIGSILIEGSLAPTWPQTYYSTGPSLTTPSSMTFSNHLVLAGDTSLVISRSVGKSQTIRVTGQLDFGGTLTVSPIPGESLSVGDTFRLFDSPKMSGSFNCINLPAAYRWDTSQLTTGRGTIRVAGLPPNTISILLVTYTNGALLIQFQSTLGRQYDLQSTLSLEPPVHWVTSTSTIGNGKVISITFGAPKTVPQRLFRVRAR